MEIDEAELRRLAQEFYDLKKGTPDYVAEPTPTAPASPAVDYLAEFGRLVLERMALPAP